MLTLKQLLEFEEKTEEYIHSLSIKKSCYASYEGTDYEISGIMPVKIDIQKNMTNGGIKYNLLSLLSKYAKEKHGSRHIYGESCGIVEDNYKREFKIKLPKYINFENDPNFVCVDGYYMSFNTSYTYHRYNKKHSDKLDKIQNKENKNKKEK